MDGWSSPDSVRAWKPCAGVVDMISTRSPEQRAMTDPPRLFTTVGSIAGVVVVGTGEDEDADDEVGGGVVVGAGVPVATGVADSRASTSDWLSGSWPAPTMPLPIAFTAVIPTTVAAPSAAAQASATVSALVRPDQGLDMRPVCRRGSLTRS